MNLLTKKQRQALLTEKKRINLYYGSVRSGKTYYSLIEWAMFVASCPVNSEFLMVGKTGTTLNRNCLRLLQEFEPSFTFSLSAKKGILYGRTIWLEGANDDRAENKIRGMTLQGVYIDELTLIPESFYYMSLSRLSLKGAKLFATTNPESPSNYVYTDIIQNDKINKNVIKFTIDDNDFLDKEYVKELKNEFTGVFYDRFILGNFVRAEGIIYTQYANNEEHYLYDTINERIQFVSIGIDYGSSRAKSTFKAVAFTNNYRNVYQIEEKEIEDTNNAENLYREFHNFYDELRSKYQGAKLYAFADWGGLGNIITNGLVIYARNNRLLVDIQNCQKGSILDRIHLTNSLFGQERLKINRKNKHMRKAFNEVP